MRNRLVILVFFISFVVGGSAFAICTQTQFNAFTGKLDYCESSTGSGSGTINSGAVGKVPVYVASTTLDDNGTPASPLQVDANGNVGIGTIGPREQLEITGNFRLPLTIDTGSPVGIIYNGSHLMAHNYPGNLWYNTFFGEDAGNLTNQGGWDTGIGYHALTLLAGGQYNTAIGSDALESLTDGNNNTALGYQALKSNTANSNIAVGYQAAAANTTGTSNVAIGVQSQNVNTNGGTNVSVGALTLLNLNGGSDNTAIGDQALRANVSASNTAVGSGALVATTGGGNTAIGVNAGITNVAGTNNTMLGTSTNVSVAGLTNATAIGYNTTVNQSNSIVLGNGANVGIGSPSPDQTLTVVGSARVSSLTSGECVQAGTGGLLATTGSACGAGGSTGWTDGGTNVFVTATADNVGIGTTSPSTQLEIVKNANRVPLMVSSVATGDGDYVIVTSAGNVGMGITGPTTKLNVKSTTDLEPVGFFQSIGNSDDGLALSLSNNMVASGSNNSGTVFLRAFLGSTTGANNFAGGLKFAKEDDYTSDSNSDSRIDFLVAVNNVNKNKMSLKSSGRLSLGDTIANGTPDVSPDATLEIVSDQVVPVLMVSSVTSGDGDYLIVQSTGNVGITAGAPASKLTVGSNVSIGTAFSATAAPANGLLVQGNVGIGTSTPINGVTIMNGNLGIGTWNPRNSLEVKGGLRVNGLNCTGNTNGGALTADANGDVGCTDDDSSGAASVGWTDGGTNVFVTATGDNVGIGTTEPSNTLEVVKQGSIPPLMISSVASGNGDQLIIMSNGNVGINSVNPTAKLNLQITNGVVLRIKGTTSGSAALFEMVNDSDGKLQIGVDGSTVSGTAGNAYIWNVGNYPLLFATNNLQWMSLTELGNLGIGTSTVPQKLYVAGTAEMRAFKLNQNACAGCVLTSDNVGVGTWKPATGGGGSYTDAQAQAATGWIDGGTNVFVASTADNVGIGTTTPSSTLEVIKSGSNAPLMISSVHTGDGDYFVIRSDGNVGIGTINPVAKLQIGGTGNVGIGSATPGTKLDIVGRTRLVGLGTTVPSIACFKTDGTLGYCTGTVTGYTCTTCN